MSTQRLLATAALAVLMTCALAAVSLVARQGQGAVMSGRVVAADGTPAAAVRVAAQLADLSSLEAATCSVFASISETEGSGIYTDNPRPGDYNDDSRGWPLCVPTRRHGGARDCR